MIKFVFVIVMLVHCFTMHSQIFDDSIHKMLYYDIVIEIKNCHPMHLQGFSDDVVLFYKKNKTLQSFADSFYAQAEYCVEPCTGVHYLPSIIVGDNTKDELIIKYGNFKKIYPSQKFKLKDCTLYVEKYLIKGRRLVSNEFHSSSVEASRVLSNYNKVKYLLYDIEPISQLMINKDEIVKTGKGR